MELIGKTLNFEQIPLSAKGLIWLPRNTAANVNISNALRTISGPAEVSGHGVTTWSVFLTDGHLFSHHSLKGLNHSDMLKGRGEYLGNNQSSLLYDTSKRLLP